MASTVPAPILALIYELSINEITAAESIPLPPPLPKSLSYIVKNDWVIFVLGYDLFAPQIILKAPG